MRKILLSVLGVLLVGLTAMAQLPQLVRNINPVVVDPRSHSDPSRGNDPNFPQSAAAINGKYYFPARNYNGVELWGTDGTTLGTHLIKDLNSGYNYSDANPLYLNTIGNQVFFFTADWDYNKNGYYNFRIHYMDGGNEFMPGYSLSNYPFDTVTNVIQANGALYFIAFNSNTDPNNDVRTTDTSLFKFDPQTYNYTLVSHYKPRNLYAAGNLIFFDGDDGVHGRELWQYDPNAGTTSLAVDVNQTGVNGGSSNPHNFYDYDNILYYSADDGTGHGYQLKYFDYVNNVTGGVLFGKDNADPRNLIAFHNRIYFRMTDVASPIYDIYYYDPLTQGVTFVATDFNGQNGPMAAVNGFLFFAANDGNSGNELWQTDLSDNTVLSQDINLGGDSDPQNFMVLGNNLLFVADDGGGPQVWTCDGTNTKMIPIQTNFNSDPPKIFGTYNGFAYLYADDGTHGKELWKTDAVSLTASLVADINKGDNGVTGSNILGMDPYKSSMYFMAYDGTNNNLYSADSAGNNVSLVAAGPAVGFNGTYYGPNQIKKAGNYLFFSAWCTDGNGLELWRSDGTQSGTVRVADINPGPNASYPDNMVEANGLLFFTADNGTNGTELWKSDGTAGGTVMVKDILPGSGSSQIRDMHTLGNKVIFVANDSLHGEELWVSDGTPAGTKMLKDINVGTAGSNVSTQLVVGNRLYFNATSAAYGSEPWYTDGTDTGTVMLKDISPGSTSSNGGYFAALGSYVYFSADSTGTSTNVLWRTDGTSAGTHTFSPVAFPFELKNIGNKIAFICFPTNLGTPLLGFEWWATDGTLGGTQKLTDFGPVGVGSMYLVDWPVHNGHMFITADDNVHGMELWQTDGTPAGTVINDIAPGQQSSYPFNGKGLGAFFVAANDGTTTGNELWKVSVSNSVTWQSFTAKQIDSFKVQMQWKTLNETNNRGFYVQHSTDNIKYDTLGFVAALSPAGASYSFIDSAAKAGHNYYRLRQVDNSGNSTFSNIEDVIIILPLKGGIIKGNDTLCIGNIPNIITDSVPVTGGKSGVYTYQWQDSVSTGHWVNIAGATQVSYQAFSALNLTTAFRRKVFDGTDSALSNVVTKVYKVVGDSSVVPRNTWNVYVYGTNGILTGLASPYYGYYSDTALTYSSVTDWAVGSNPSLAGNYQGCPLPNNYYFSMVMKRKGFTPGNYVINFPNFNDVVQVFLNHVQYANIATDGAAHLVSLGALDTSSVVEIRYGKYGGPTGLLNFNFFQSSLQPGSISGSQTTCANQSPGVLGSTSLAYGGPAPLKITYQWQDSTAGGTWQDLPGANNPNFICPGLPVSTYFRRQVTDSSSPLQYSDTVLVTVTIVTETPVIFNTGRLLTTNPVANVQSYKWFNNGVEILGANSATYLATNPGTYTAKYVMPCGAGPASNSIVFNTTAVAQNITFPQPPDVNYGTGLFVKLAATDGSGLPIHYRLNSGPGTLSHDTIFVGGTGTFSITASQPGDNLFLPAQDLTQGFNVNRANSVITFPPVTNKKLGDPNFALNATASSGLPIYYSWVSGPAYLASNNIVVLTGGGQVVIRASQPGDGNYSPASDVLDSFCVGIQTLGTITGDTVTCPGVYRYALPAVPGALYHWSVSGGGVLTPNGDSVTVSWQTPGTYTLQVTATSACDPSPSTAATLVVRVASVLVPGAVTNMIPANGAINLQLPLTLSWIPGQYDNTYDIFVWDIDSARPATPYVTGIYGVNYVLPNTGFKYNHGYKWQVISHSGCASTSGPVQTFTLIPLADLAVSNIQIPATAFSGQPIAISWKVTNHGPGPTNLNQSWSDAIFLSFDTVPNFVIPPNTNSGAWNQLSFPVRPLLLGVVPNVSALDSGASYSNTFNFTLPLNYNWPLYAYVVTNYSPTASAPLETTRTNDTARAPGFIDVTLSPTPDLRVDTVLTPSPVFSGSTINVTYKVKNYGVMTPAGQGWADKIYISRDPLFNINTAILLKLPKANGTYYYNAPDAIISNSAQLQQDSFYTRSLSVVVPNFIFGSYYVYVVTDANNNIYEGPDENNNSAYSLGQVILTPTPLLTVASVTLPTQVASTTQPLALSWNLKNIGFSDNLQKNQGHYLETLAHCPTCYVPYCPPPPPDCNGCVYICPSPQSGYRVQDSLSWGSSHWADNVYLSTDSVSLDVNNAILLGNYPHGTNDGTDYDNVTSVPHFPGSNTPLGSGIPDGVNPRSYDLNAATAIINNGVYPGGLTTSIPDYLPAGNYYLYVLANADNAVFEYPPAQQYRRSAVLTVQRPDLVTPTVTVPASAMAGQTINIQYSVLNNGPGTVYQHFRRDFIYMSTHAAFDGSAQLIGQPTYSENLPLSSAQAHQFSYKLPVTLSGTYYFYVLANADSSFRETNMANNRNANDIGTNIISISPAQTAVLASATLNLGDTLPTVFGFPFRYSVPNTGVASTSGSWLDSIYISCSPTFDRSTAVLLALRSHSDIVPVGSSYSDSFNVVLPFSFNLMNCFPKATYSPVYFFVRVDADGGLYQGAGINPVLISSSQKTLFNPFMDLAVSSFTASDSASVARYYNASWTVVNKGLSPGSNGYQGWADAVYFSKDSVFNNNAIIVGYSSEGSILNTNQSYNGTGSFLVPKMDSGRYYVFIDANFSHNLSQEIDYSNNTSLLRDGTGAAKSIYVSIPALPDLVDSIVNAPLVVATGQPLTITYQVTNQGPGVTFPGNWGNDIWLSSDYIIGNSYGDISLGYNTHYGSLAPGQSFTDSIQTTISSNIAPGNYILIGRANANSNVVESNATNNLGFRYITIFTPAPSDLQVSNIAHPDTAWLGLPDTTVWNVTNNSGNLASGYETDGVYLSKTPVLDSTAILLGTIKNKLNLLPLGKDTVSNVHLIHDVPEGAYYLIVKTDILDNIIETDKTNNTGIAVKQIYVKVKQLPLNVVTADTLGKNPLYYKMVVPSQYRGGTLLVTLKTNDSLSVNNQLYIGLGYVPSQAHFDYEYGAPNAGNQQILMSSVTDSVYYISMLCASASQPLQQVTLNAVNLPFSILNVNAAQGGNIGNVTVKLTGSLFDSTMQAKLSNGAATIYASTVYFINSTTVYATFNLQGKALGTYNITLTKADASTTTLANSFAIVNADNGGIISGGGVNTGAGDGTSPGCDPGAASGLNSQLQVEMIIPQKVFIGWVFPIQINYNNPTNFDVPAQVRILYNDHNALFALTQDGVSTGTNSLYLQLTEQNGPPGIIRAGGSGTITVYCKFPLGMPGHTVVKFNLK